MTQQEFLGKYGIHTTFEEMSKATGYLKFMGDILPSETGKNAELMMYKQGLDFMLTKFIDSQTNMDGFDNNRTLWDFDLVQFAKDFEDVMISDPLKRDVGRRRKPYEGAELEVLDSLKETAQKYCEDIKDVLASRIKRGADLGVFRKNTLIDLNRAGYDERDENKKNVSTMYLAMKNVIGKRTWADRINPLNWFRMINENIYMLQLNSRMKDITREELKSDPVKISGRGNGYRNLEEAMETHAKQNAYSSSVIQYDAITELEQYREGRAEAIPEEMDLETTIVERTSMIVVEAADDLDRTIDTQELNQDEPTKVHNRSMDSL